jgi:uncharacterized phage-associated protein
MEFVDDVAAAVLAGTTQRYPGDEFTAKKLEKLVFYCQAWSLVSRSEPMFADPIEAWAEGPMIRHLYDQHRGRRLVRRWTSGHSGALSDESWAVVMWVVTSYGRYTGEQLGEMTHREAPWRETRRGLADGVRSERPIPLEEIRDFYASLALDADAAVRFAVASSALEGIVIGPPAAALLAEVAQRRMDPDEAVARYLAAID